MVASGIKYGVLATNAVEIVDVIKFYYDQTNEMFDTDFEPPK